MVGKIYVYIIRIKDPKKARIIDIKKRIIDRIG